MERQSGRGGQKGLLGLLAILALMLAAWAADSAPSLDWGALAAPYRLANETYSAAPAQVNSGEWLFLLYINGTPVSLVRADLGADGKWAARVLEDEAGLKQAAQDYRRAAGQVEMARQELDGAEGEMQAYNASRTRERDCLEALGILRQPCISYGTCLSACSSSVQFCQPLALANGQSFVYQIWDYKNRSWALDGALAGQEREYEGARNAMRSAAIRAFNLSLEPVWEASAGVLRSPLNGRVCQKPFYDSGTPARVQAHLQKALDWLAPAEDGGAEAAQLMKEMQRRRQAVQAQQRFW
ncbi:Uncharacterised protein [uncultured archaeon]|nr:Uncharacterised protein [uncultured archaeon]